MRAILKFINTIIWYFGLRLVKLSKFDRLVAKLLTQTSPIKFVQIGANDGVRFDSLYFTVTQHRWPGLVVEPLPDIFERLRSNYLDYPEVTPINIAVHPTDLVATIYRVDQNHIGKCPDWAAGIASFLPNHHEKLNIPSEFVVSEVVKCRPLMSILSEYKMLDASLLQIDTEGYDSEVIKMIDFES
jgi:FkbM family methyltransferase